MRVSGVFGDVVEWLGRDLEISMLQDALVARSSERNPPTRFSSFWLPGKGLPLLRLSPLRDTQLR